MMFVCLNSGWQEFYPKELTLISVHVWFSVKYPEILFNTVYGCRHGLHVYME